MLRRQLGLIFVVLAGLAASVIAYCLAEFAEQRRIHDEFHRRAEVRHALIRENIRGYEECVYSLRNLFANSDDVTLDEFVASTGDIRTRHYGIQALQWVPSVSHEHRAEVEAWARSEIAPYFTFTERTADGALVPAANRPVYYPILYTAPLLGNELALGFDLRVGPSHADLARGLKTRNLVMTRKVRLVQEQAGANRFGTVMNCSVFRVSDGLEHHLGFVQIVFKIDDMFDQSWVNYPANALDVLVLDVTHEDGADQHLYSRRSASGTDSSPLLSLADLPKEYLHIKDLPIGGRIWRCHYAPAAGWMAAQVSATPRMVFAGGLAFTFVLTAYFLSVRRRSEQVEHQVTERTAELRHTQRLLEADIHKRQTAEAELRESRRQLDSLLGQMPGMAYRYLHDDPPSATFISRGSIEILGLTPHELTSGKVRYDDLILMEDRPGHQSAVAIALSNQSAYESEYRLRDKQGRVKWMLDRGQGIYSAEGKLLFIEGLAIDITGRKQAEADKAAFDRKLLESQKLESLGVLAGGIAHDFNNLLTTIVGHASVVRSGLAEHSPTHAHLEQIESGAQRAGELCQQMLAYAGKGRFLVQLTSLEALVRDTTPLLEHSISKRATLHFDFRPGVPDIEVDATQIRQIIMNLVVNASDALGDHDGVISVETGVMRRTDPLLNHAVIPPPPADADFACLRVRDTGSGMTPETIAKIFDPFFTTKFAGRGLGLAAVLGIVRSHSGGLLVSSALGAGSTFTLLLPATTTPGIERETPLATEASARPLSGTVLLVDDEDGVRSVAEVMLRTLGLQTLIAVDGMEGVIQFKKHQPVISLVLLDLTMPRLGGEQTLRAIRALAPRLPVILMSGYNQSAVLELRTDDHVSFLQKPFSLHALRTQISQMLR